MADSRYYYNVRDGIKIVSNVPLSKIERGFYMRQVRKYGNLLKSLEVIADDDGGVTLTANLETPHIHLTQRPQI